MLGPTRPQLSDIGGGGQDCIRLHFEKIKGSKVTKRQMMHCYLWLLILDLVLPSLVYNCISQQHLKC